MDNTFLAQFYGKSQIYTDIPNHLYKDFNVKKGLRNEDGTGVLVGLTRVADVVGYKYDDEGHKIDTEGTLYFRGIDINESFSIMIAGFNNSYLNKLLKSIQYSLRQGFSLYTSFKNTHLNNSIFMELINVGEQTGMLKETLHYNNVFLSKDVDNFIDEFTKFL